MNRTRPSRTHRAEQEVQRLDRMLQNRRARVDDAERKLTAAKERLRAVKRGKTEA